MAEPNIFARLVAPATVKRGTYLGRIRIIEVDFGIVAAGGIDIYDSTSYDTGTPFSQVTVVNSFESTDGSLDFMSGATANNLFCVVDVNDKGEATITFNGIHFAWFQYHLGPPPTWQLVAKQGSGVAQVFTGEAGQAFVPFAQPFGAKVCVDGYPVNYLGTNQSAFVSCVGIAGVPEDWRLEYQACSPDDEDNDEPPGIRSPWNFLSANCCTTSEGGDDDDGTGDTDDDDEDDGGGGGEDDEGRCEELGFLCRLIVRECFDINGNPFHKYCLIDDLMGCVIHTGGRCFCDTRRDVNGDIVPPPNTLPPGTVIITRCGPPSNILKCSEIPQEPGGAYYCPP